jgi:hypothetical protein
MVEPLAGRQAGDVIFPGYACNVQLRCDHALGWREYAD